jgi:hypothetical protein
MDTIFTISGIFFLYYFLVRLSGKTRNGVHSVQKKFVPGHSGNFAGIFQDPFLYNFLVRLYVNTTSARSTRKYITERKFPPKITNYPESGKIIKLK